MTGSEHRLLIAHATRWAEQKKRTLDSELLEEVLDLVHRYDERSAQAWPPGSARALVLQRWPANGPGTIPDADVLTSTLDSFWRFLRATGRMTSASAAPADLVKELRRALPAMAGANDDRANWSQGRVLADFGASLGIRLDGADTIEELQERLDAVTAAWNGLPVEERHRLMPDASPKTAKGATVTAAVNEAGRYAPDDDPSAIFPAYRRGIRSIAIKDFEESGFLRRIRQLVDWVGEGRPVTRNRVLRPAVAKEAYAALGLFDWELRLQRHQGVRTRAMKPEAKEVMAAAWADAIRSAGDCEPLDRLWYPAEGAGLLDITSTTARRGSDPVADPFELGLVLLGGLAHRFGMERLQPLLAILAHGMVDPDGAVDLARVREVFHERFVAGDRGLWADEFGQALVAEVVEGQVGFSVGMFDDTGIWRRVGDELTITDFGREVAVVLFNMAGPDDES